MLNLNNKSLTISLYSIRCRLQTGNKSEYKIYLPQIQLYYTSLEVYPRYQQKLMHSEFSPPLPKKKNGGGIYNFKLEKLNGNLQAKENQIHILIFTFVLFTSQIKMFFIRALKINT